MKCFEHMFYTMPDIMIWEFDKLSEHEKQKLQSITKVSLDDISWVAIINKQLPTPAFLDTGTEFGCCCVERYKVNDDYDVLIGYHS